MKDLMKYTLFVFTTVFTLLSHAEKINVAVDKLNLKHVIKLGSSDQLPIKYLWAIPHCYSTFSQADKDKMLKLLAPQTIEDINSARQDDLVESLAGSAEQLKEFNLDYKGPADSLKNFIETTWASCVQEDESP